MYSPSRAEAFMRSADCDEEGGEVSRQVGDTVGYPYDLGAHASRHRP